ncbi:protein LphB [Legionella geestiana]|uniref:protein LphB n=1 Tax=Legionella geestiana TaxID=45065 RepID=UPI001093291E|nr:protein LphB [Legionella geestiana]QDQ38927.1 protein LphB [Legionella geestiana]
MREKIGFYALVGMLGLLTAFQLQAVWPFVVDDAWIPLRYAKHLVAGLGIVWNHGESPLEGFSSFSFMLLGAGALWLGQNPLLWLKVAGTLGLLATLAGVFTLTRFWFQRIPSLIPVFWLLLYRGEMLWAVGGLETAVYQALLVWATVFAFRAAGFNAFAKARDAINPAAFMVCALMLAAGGMTRPETPAFMLLFGLWFLSDKSLVSTSEGRRGILMFTLTLTLVWGSWFLWRWQYFNGFFPNPVYCKGISESHYVLAHRYLRLIGIWLLPTLPILFKSFDRRFILLLAPGVFYLMALLHAEDIVAFDNRLFLPAFALFLPLPLLGLEAFTRRFLSQRAPNAVLLAVGILTGVLWIPSLTPAEYRHYIQNPLQHEQLRIKTLQWIRAHSTPQTRIVMGDSGQIPAEIDAVFIDSFCLNNRVMARMPLKVRAETFCKDILATNPDMVIVTELIMNGKTLTLAVDRCLAGRLSQTKAWKEVRVFKTLMSHNSSYQYRIYQRMPVKPDRAETVKMR